VDVDVDVEVGVVKATMRTDGRVNKTSIWGSGLDASLALGTEGRLKVRRATGVAGVEEAIASFSSSCNPLYCLITMVVQSKVGRDVLRSVVGQSILMQFAARFPFF
jgi:hypothetical protein